MYYVVFLAGIWVAMLPYMSWNKEVKKFSILHITIGFSICLGAALNWMNQTPFTCVWLQISYILLCALEIVEIIKKLKMQKVVLDTLAIVVAVIGLILSVLVWLSDYSAVESSILMITGAMIILSIPFNKM